MNLSYATNYWHNESHKREFNDFLVRIHNLGLTNWEEMGYWDNDYRPFSLFEDDRIISNVCLYSMDMMVAGERSRVAQISAAGLARCSCVRAGAGLGLRGGLPGHGPARSGAQTAALRGSRSRAFVARRSPAANAGDLSP